MELDNILGEKMFMWEIPRTKDSLCSVRVRFTKKEFERFIKPRLMFE